MRNRTKSRHVDLLHGPVMPALSKLAIPIMATSLMQTAYSLIDMVWIGYLGSPAVAAVGAAGMYTWLSNGLGLLPKIGAQVNVAYSLGSGNKTDASRYFWNGMFLTAALGIAYGIFCTVFSKQLIGFFNLTSWEVIDNAVIYLQITCGLVIFSFLNLTAAGHRCNGGSSCNSVCTVCSDVDIFIPVSLRAGGDGRLPCLDDAGPGICRLYH